MVPPTFTSGPGLTAQPGQAQNRAGRGLIAWVLVFAAVMAGLNVYAAHSAQSTLSRLMPLMGHSDDLQQGLLHIHHDGPDFGNRTTQRLDHAFESLAAMRAALAEIVPGADTQRLTAHLDTVDQALEQLDALVRTGMAHTDTAPPDSAGQAVLATRVQDRTLAAQQAAAALHRALEDIIERQVAWSQNTSIFLYTLFAGVVVAALVLLRRQSRQQRRQDLDLRKLGQGVEQSPASIVITNPSGIIEYVNPRFEQVTGYAAHEVIGQNPRILQSGQMDASFYQGLWHTITSGQVWRGEILNRRKDGSLYWERASISPIRDDDGTIRNYVAVKEDITERKADELKLKQSRELFSRAFHSNPALIALSEPESGRHVDVNESWCRTLQYSREDAIGRTAFEMGLWPHVEDREQILAELEKKGRLRNFDTQLKARDGTLIDCLISTEPIVMDERELVLWSANDITQRRQSERESEYRRVLFEAIFNGIPDAIVYADPNRAIVQVNPGLEKTFGFAADELLGEQTVALYASADEYERQGRLRFHLSAERKLAPYVVNYKRKDGSIFPGETLGTPIADQDGTVLGYIAVIRDITERTRIEGQLIHAKEEAEYANYAKSQFLANMSHELRTPLNAILGFAEMMRLETFGPLGDDKYQEYVDDIAKSGQHLLAIITDILDISKIESGHMELNPETVDLNALVRAALTILEAQASRKHVTVNLALQHDLPLITADPLRLKQVVINLLSNAIKFTLSGGRVDVETFVRGDGGLALVVTDTGIGIREEDIAHVLRPFGQAGEITSRAYEGTGLGLSLSKALVDLHGGTLTIESAPGEGTVVTCLLPPARTIRL